MSGPLLFTCPATKTLVQHWLDDSDEVPEDGYEGVDCPACAQVHFYQSQDGQGALLPNFKGLIPSGFTSAPNQRNHGHGQAHQDHLRRHARHGCARCPDYCADYRCSHSIAVSADRWPDDLRLSDIEPHFICGACGKRGADVRPDFNWSKTPAVGMGYC
jgi:hypothetical protein